MANFVLNANQQACMNSVTGFVQMAMLVDDVPGSVVRELVEREIDKSEEIIREEDRQALTTNNKEGR